MLFTSFAGFIIGHLNACVLIVFVRWDIYCEGVLEAQLLYNRVRWKPDDVASF